HNDTAPGRPPPRRRGQQPERRVRRADDGNPSDRDGARISAVILNPPPLPRPRPRRLRRRHVSAKRSPSPRLDLKTAATRGFAPALRRRQCADNGSSTPQNAHKTPSAVTAETPETGLEITAGVRALTKSWADHTP